MHTSIPPLKGRISLAEKKSIFRSAKMLFFVSVLVFVTAPLGAGALTATTTVVADTWVSGFNASTNFGGSSEMQADSRTSHNRWAYLKFDMPALAGTISSIKLRVYMQGTMDGDTSLQLNAYEMSQTNWGEYTATYNTYDGTNAWSQVPPYASTTPVSLPRNVTSAGWQDFYLTGVSSTTNPMTIDWSETFGIRIGYTQQVGTYSSIAMTTREGTNKPYIEITYTADPVYGCMDLNATNFDLYADTPDNSCVYADISPQSGYVITPSYPYNTQSIALPQMFAGGINYSWAGSTTTPYWYSSAGGSGWYMYFPYELKSPLRSIYIIGDPITNPNYTRKCQANGGTVVGNAQHFSAGSFYVPDTGTSTRLVYVTRFDIYKDAGTCLWFDLSSIPAGHRIYKVIASPDNSLTWNSSSTFNAYVNAVASSTTSGNTYQTASTTLAVCDTLDLGCYFGNALQYVFIPDPVTIMKFQNLTLASSSPFSYAYDIPRLRDELLNTSTTTVIAWTLPFHTQASTTATVSLISVDQLNAIPFLPLLRTILGWLLWVAFAELIYYQILRVHNKEHIT